MTHSITRRSFLEGTAGLLACTPALAKTENRPNIILCMGDDHGWDETGYYGHPHVKTPVMDEMSETGLRMDNFYSAAPVCSPTRGSVMTGRHPNRYGTFSANWSIRPEEISIARVLNKAGYACGHFGKWHLGPVKAGSPTNPGAMGFEEWLSHDNFFEMNPWLSRNGGPPKQFKGESSEIVVKESLDFIRRAKQSGRPFFVVIWFGSPHEPYSGLEKDLALYNDLPASYQERTVRITGMKTGRPSDERLDKVLAARYAEITAMDRSIGTLRQSLKKDGLRENTLLWFFSDNGVPVEANVTTPFRGQKGSVYDGGLRVPSIVEWPDRIPGNRVSTLNGVTSDILPTLCDIVDRPVPDRPLDGISLRKLIDSHMEERPEPICFWSYDSGREANSGLEPYIKTELQEGTTPLAKIMDGKYTRSFRNFHHPQVIEADFAGPRAILDNQYKLIVAGEADETQRELFDLRKDRAETTNLLENKAELARGMEQRLKEWQESVLNSLAGADYL